MRVKFVKCNKCGQIAALVSPTGVPLYCCGEPMKEITPHIDDASPVGEKHVPTFRIKKNKVMVFIGSKPHPSNKGHYIEWILLETNKGNQRKVLSSGDFPKANFYLDKDEKILGIYSYCNIHGLYKLDVDDASKYEVDEDDFEETFIIHCESHLDE